MKMISFNNAIIKLLEKLLYFNNVKILNIIVDC